MEEIQWLLHYFQWFIVYNTTVSTLFDIVTIVLLEIGQLLCFILLGSMIGMIIDRNLLSKFFSRYETFFFTISVIMPLCSCESNEMILVLFPLRNTTFEVVLGLSVLFCLQCHVLCYSSSRSARTEVINEIHYTWTIHNHSRWRNE